MAALESYKPELSAVEAEDYLSKADDGTLDIAQAFRDVGLAQVVAAGETAEPQLASEPDPAALQPQSTPSDITSPETPPQAMPSSIPMTLLAVFQRPRARLSHTMGGNTLTLVDRPSEASTEIRYLERRGHTHRLSLLRVVSGTFSTLRLPAPVTEVSVRYTDPYDVERDSKWTILPAPPTRANTGKEMSR